MSEMEDRSELARSAPKSLFGVVVKMSNELQKKLEKVVIYSPTPEQIRFLHSQYGFINGHYESWVGLPQVDFHERRIIQYADERDDGSSAYETVVLSHASRNCSIDVEKDWSDEDGLPRHFTVWHQKWQNSHHYDVRADYRELGEVVKQAHHLNRVSIIGRATYKAIKDVRKNVEKEDRRLLRFEEDHKLSRSLAAVLHMDDVFLAATAYCAEVGISTSRSEIMSCWATVREAEKEWLES